MPAKIDLVGASFRRLTVVAESSERKNGRRLVTCVCDCGSIVTADPRYLRNGKTTSCGCYQREAVAKVCRGRTKHGDVGSKEYVAWIHIRARCSNPSDAKYKDYGQRGIKVCDRWDASYEAFLSDMGRAPSPKHSIDRVDVDGDYSPNNCRWATPTEQARNKRNHRLVELNGRTMPLSEACELDRVKYRSALYRLNNGKPWRHIPAPPANGRGE